MSIDDKQRIAAIETLQALGYSDHFASRSAAPAGTVACTCRTVSDPMHGALMRHANALARYTEGPPEHVELTVFTDAIDAYEAKRRPRGKATGGNG